MGTFALHIIENKIVIHFFKVCRCSERDFVSYRESLKHNAYPGPRQAGFSLLKHPTVQSLPSYLQHPFDPCTVHTETVCRQSIKSDFFNRGYRTQLNYSAVCLIVSHTQARYYNSAKLDLKTFKRVFH